MTLTPERRSGLGSTCPWMKWSGPSAAEAEAWCRSLSHSGKKIMILKIVELTQECDKEHGQGWLHSGITIDI